MIPIHVDEEFSALLDEVAEIREVQPWEVFKLEERARQGHSAGCLCQCRPGPSCRELRIAVGYKEVQRIFKEG